MLKLTPAGFLLLRALVGGSKTSFGESGKSFDLKPEGDEKVFIFKTDTPELREHFGIGRDEKASDAMVLYVAPAAARHALFFVELKGKDYRTATEQLKRMIHTVRTKLEPNLGQDFLDLKRLVALIVSDRGAPSEMKRLSESFYKETKIPLQFVSRGSANLRDFLPR